MIKPSNVSHEQRVAWGRMGGFAAAARQTPNQRRLGSKKALAAKYAKYTHEELSQKYAGHFTRILARFTSEQAVEIRRGAGQKRWLGVSAEERSKQARKAIQSRHAKTAYTRNPEPAERLLTFLREFIRDRSYSPTVSEVCKGVHHNRETVSGLLRQLQSVGRIQRGRWDRGIALCETKVLTGATPANSLEPETEILITTVALAPRGKKCYECDAPAVNGKTRCERHLALGLAAKNRAYLHAAQTKRRTQ
jgi:hypothetical protein